MTATLQVASPETPLKHTTNCKTETYQSWGRYPRVAHRHVSKVYWRDQIPELLERAEPESMLPYGMGRSYGDSCLNDVYSFLQILYVDSHECSS